VFITRFGDSISDSVIDDLDPFFFGEGTSWGLLELKFSLPIIISGEVDPVGGASPEHTVLVSLVENPEPLFLREVLFTPDSRNLLPPDCVSLAAESVLFTDPFNSGLFSLFDYRQQLFLY